MTTAESPDRVRSVERPAPARPGAAEVSRSRMATLFDEQGEPLATVVGDYVTPDELFVTSVVDGGGRLLAHRFGRGRHCVIVELDGTRLMGRLLTRWYQNHREWKVDIDTACPPETAGEPSSRHR